MFAQALPSGMKPPFIEEDMQIFELAVVSLRPGQEDFQSALSSSFPSQRGGGSSLWAGKEKREFAVRNAYPGALKTLARWMRRMGQRFLGVVMWPPIWCWASLSLLALGADVPARTETASAELEAIITRMAHAREENRASFRSYLVARDYNFFGKEKDKSKSRVIVDVTFVPPDSKNFAIPQTTGSGLGERVVRRLLESEKEIARDHKAADISRDNYAFSFVREEVYQGRRCQVLELLPKRKDRNLLHAQIWVDAETYPLHWREECKGVKINKAPSVSEGSVPSLPGQM